MKKLYMRMSKVFILALVIAIMFQSTSYAMISTGKTEDEAAKISIGKTYTTSNDENDSSASILMGKHPNYLYAGSGETAPIYRFEVRESGQYVLTQKAKRLTANINDAGQGNRIFLYNTKYKEIWQSNVQAEETHKETFQLEKGTYYIKMFSSQYVKAKGSISI